MMVFFPGAAVIFGTGVLRVWYRAAGVSWGLGGLLGGMSNATTPYPALESSTRVPITVFFSNLSNKTVILKKTRARPKKNSPVDSCASSWRGDVVFTMGTQADPHQTSQAKPKKEHRKWGLGKMHSRR